jgi:hypothetical protein
VKTEKTYRLWTFQSIQSIKELQTTGILQARWDRYCPTGYFIKAYQWMAKQMVERNINCHTHAPIWAWHSCEKYEQAPTLVDARCLLSDIELADGIQTIEFECPVEVVLLSRYGIWNMLLHEYLCCNKEADIDRETEHMLFATERKQFKKYASIQATLPYLKIDWVKQIRDLNLKPGDFNYDPAEAV